MYAICTLIYIVIYVIDFLNVFDRTQNFTKA